MHGRSTYSERISSNLLKLVRTRARSRVRPGAGPKFSYVMSAHPASLISTTSWSSDVEGFDLSKLF